MNKQLVIIGVMALLILGGGILYISRPGEAPQTKSVAQETTETSETEDTNLVHVEQKGVTEPTSIPSATTFESSEVKAFTVESNNFKFSLSEIRVKKGDTVKVTFINKVGIHDWVLDEFSVRTKQIQAGQSETVTFTADKTGTFEYYCSVGQHRAFGMKGKLIVE